MSKSLLIVLVVVGSVVVIATVLIFAMAGGADVGFIEISNTE